MDYKNNITIMYLKTFTKLKLQQGQISLAKLLLMLVPVTRKYAKHLFIDLIS